MESFLWAAGITALVIILHRAILAILALHKASRSYADEVDKMLNSEEHKVKGRFE